MASWPVFSGFSGDFSLYFGRNLIETGEHTTASTTNHTSLRASLVAAHYRRDLSVGCVHRLRVRKSYR